jgi:hypothetical protein
MARRWSRVTFAPEVCQTRPSIAMMDPAGALNATDRSIRSAGTSSKLRQCWLPGM